MNGDTKKQIPELGKVVGAIALAAAGLVVLTNQLLPSPAKPKTVGFTWDYPADELPWTIFEFVVKTNMNQPWRFFTNVVGTNVLIVAADQAQAFFTISRTISAVDTNVFIKQRGF